MNYRKPVKTRKPVKSRKFGNQGDTEKQLKP